MPKWGDGIVRGKGESPRRASESPAGLPLPGFRLPARMTLSREKINQCRLAASKYSTAMRTATPFSTCCRMMD